MIDWNLALTVEARATLIAECARREAAGLMIPIVIRRAVAPRGRRVRVARGLTGEPVTWEAGRLICYVDPATLRALLTGRSTVRATLARTTTRMS